MTSPELRWHDEAALHRPILVLAFRGMFDAADAATTAVTWLADRSPGPLLADVDPEGFFDFTQQRPVVRFAGDGRRVIRWPENELRAALSPEGGHDLVLLAGIEPHLRWRTFCGLLVEAVRRLGVEMVVTLGSMVGMTPHSRPPSVTASSTSDELARRLGLGRPSYEGPTGVIGTVHDALDREGVPVISLRVGVPHYVPSAPNPKAVRALLRRFEAVTGIETGHAELDRAASQWQEQVEAAVLADPEAAAYVRQLEAQVDRTEELLPSGDDLAAELEAFLREQRPDD
jgi:proteasome assembly chaperone (PAC2) family protein